MLITLILKRASWFVTQVVTQEALTVTEDSTQHVLIVRRLFNNNVGQRILAADTQRMRMRMQMSTTRLKLGLGELTL